MPRHAKRCPNLIAPLATATVVALTGCRRGPPPPPSSAAAVPTVAVVSVQPDRIIQRLDLTGEVRPWSSVVLSARVSGRLERLAVQEAQGVWKPLSEGSLVRRGEVLAWIDTALYETRAGQAEAAAAVAEAQFQDAVREERRMISLFEAGSVTEQMRDKAVTARAIAEAARAQAQAALALARMDLDEARLRSPVNGTVVRKHVDEGSLVSAGMPLLTIEDLSRVKVLVGLPERYLAAVRPGATLARLSSDALAQGAVETAVTKVYPSVEPATRTGTLEIHLDNPDGAWRSGSFVRVSLEVAHADDALVIPLSAITWLGPDAWVFIVEGNRIRRGPVKIGIRDETRCQITEGLRPGDRLVIEASRDLRDGDEVKVREGGRS